MKKTGWKETIRSIKKSWVSWLAMSVVTMIGCGVCFGVYFYGNALEDKGESFFAETAYEDIGIIATQGLAQDEVGELEEIPGIRTARGCYYFPDAVLKTDADRKQVAVYTITDDLSQLKLVEGQLPEKENECALTADEMKRLSLKPGDQVELFLTDEDLPEDLMKAESFTVTAAADHPESVQNESDMYVYLPEAAIDTEKIEDYYTYIRLETDADEGLSSLGSKYPSSLQPVKEAVKEKLSVIGPEHDKKAKKKAQDKLDKEKKKAEKKLAKAQKDIDKADKKIADADKKIKDAHKKIDEADEKVADADKKIADAEDEIEDNASKLSKAKKEIKKGEKELNKGEKQLKEAREQLDKGKKKLEPAKTQLASGKKKLDKAEKEYKKSKKQYEAAKAAGLATEAAGQQIKEAGKQLADQKAVYKAQKKKYDESAKVLSQKEKEYKNGKNKLEASRSKLTSSRKKVKEGEKELAKAREELKEKKEELEEKKEELQEKKEELKDKEKELADAKLELADAKETYQDKKEETDEKIADAQKEIDDLEPSSYGYILRNEKSGHVALAQDISILRSMAMVFNLIFMVIGVIVIVSTITIRIDNDKKLLGTMKAYGFRNSEIITKYVVYGTSAIIVGIGLSLALAAGLQAVMRAFIGNLFIVRPDRFAFYPGFFGAIAALEIVAAIFSAAIATKAQVSKSSAVDLMSGNSGTKRRNKKKSSGRSDGGGLYARLIIRNMTNDLPRVITSVVIIAGSCLMMGVGFTMKGSIDNMMQASADQINHYDMEASFVSEFSEEKMDKLMKKLESKDISFKRIQKQVTKYGFGDIEEYTTILAGPEDIYDEYILLTDMKGHKLDAPVKGHAVVCNRNCEALGVKDGDTLSIFNNDFKPYEIKNGGICRNYTGKLIYLSQEDYQDIFGEKADDNTLLIRLDKEAAKTLEEELSGEFPELTISFTDEFPDLLASIKDMTNIIVYILTALSILMSVFVLLNLVNIFVGRRRNELIIMAVNGFSRREQIGYLLKETIVTTGLGLLIGGLGLFAMTEFVVRMIESEGAMFVRSFNGPAAIKALILEAAFALVINMFAYRQIRKWKITDITK